MLNMEQTDFFGKDGSIKHNMGQINQATEVNCDKN